MEPVIAAVLYVISLLPSLYLRYAPFRTIIDEKKKKQLFTGYLCLFVLYIIGLPVLFYTGVLHYHVTVFAKIFMVGYLPFVFWTVWLVRPYWYQHLFILGFQSMYMMTVHSIVRFCFQNWDGQALIVEYFCLYFALLCAGVYPVRKLLDHMFIEQKMMFRIHFWKWASPIPILLAYYHAQLMHAEYNLAFYNVWYNVFQVLAFLLFAYSVTQSTKRVDYLSKVVHQRNETRQQMDMLSQYAGKLRREDQNLAVLRHDTRHHLRILAELIENDEYEKAEAFLNRLREEESSHD